MAFLTTFRKRELDFCNAYVKLNNNAEQAMLAIGYSPTTARKQAYLMLKRPEVKERIEKIMAKLEEKTLVTYEWKVKKLQEIIDSSFKVKKKVIDDVTGEEVLVPEFSKVAIQAMAELNKMQGHYAPTKNMNLYVNTTLDKITEAKRQYKEF